MDFVFYLDREWSGYHRPLERYTELAKRLAPFQGKVLCVNRPVCLFTGPLLRFNKWREWINGNRVSQLDDNLYVYTPHILLHDLLAAQVPGATGLNRRLLAKQVQKLLLELGFCSTERVAWVADPRMSSYFDVAQETLKIYECIDNHRAQMSSPKAKDNVERLEKKVCVEADVVFCTALGLYEKKKKFNPNTYFLPNAADVKLLSKVLDPGTALAEFMQGLAHPIIGYLGTIHEHTDIALMKYIAEKRPEWTIVMVGPEQQKDLSRSQLFTSFKQLPNVHLVGWIERNDLPGYCKAFDVCVIPYRMDSDFNHYVNPDKLHEYTAMGKPVVSTDIPELHFYRSIIKVAYAPDDFVRAIESSLAEDSTARVRERLSMAQNNSWEKRAKQVLEIVNTKIEKRKKYIVKN